jgi:hypothetical protein
MKTAAADRGSFLPVITHCPFPPAESPTGGDLISLNKMKKTRGRQPARLLKLLMV